MDMETEKCEDCGAEEELVYDDDGRLLCTDCLFERQCMEDYNGS